MKKGTVEHVIDLSALPPLTEADRADLARLRNMSDHDIDRSDIPALTEEAWSRGLRNPILRARTGQTATIISLDDDVLAWFKAQGQEYEARINAVLRRAMSDLSSADRN